MISIILARPLPRLFYTLQGFMDKFILHNYRTGMSFTTSVFKTFVLSSCTHTVGYFQQAFPIFRDVNRLTNVCWSSSLSFFFVNSNVNSTEQIVGVYTYSQADKTVMMSLRMSRKITDVDLLF